MGSGIHIPAILDSSAQGRHISFHARVQQSLGRLVLDSSSGNHLINNLDEIKQRWEPTGHQQSPSFTFFCFFFSVFFLFFT
jgi:hypothetical protein